MQGFEGLSEAIDSFIRALFIVGILAPGVISALVGGVSGIRLPHVNVLDGVVFGSLVGFGGAVANCAWILVAFGITFVFDNITAPVMIVGCVIIDLAAAWCAVLAVRARSGRLDYEEFLRNSRR